MRGLTANEMGCVAGGWDNNDNWQNPDPSGMTTGFGAGPAPSSSTGGNGSGNNGINPITGQKLIDVVMGVGAATDPTLAHGAGEMGDAAHAAQNYNQAGPKGVCEQVDGGTWDPNAHNGAGECK